MPNWFVMRDSGEQGPLSSEQLRKLVLNGQVRSDDLLRREDIAKPVRAGSVKGLFDAKESDSAKPQSPAPPPIVPPVQKSNVIPASPATPTPRPFVRTKKRGPSMKAVAVGGLGACALFLMCCFGGLGMIAKNSGTKKSPSEPNADSSAMPVAGVDVPDFAKLDYDHDFSKDDYETIPAGAKRHTKRIVIEQGDKELIGKPQQLEGYLDKAGKFVEHGTFIVWADAAESRKLREGKCRHGKVHGMMIDYYPNGKKSAETPSVDGLKRGTGRLWYVNGTLERESKFLDGKLHGVGKGWYDTGVPEVESTWLEGKQHGPSKAWYKTGKPMYTSGYANGLLHGPCVFYSEDSSGFETRRGQYDHDKPIGRWRFGFLSDNGQVYYIEVEAGLWIPNTREEFIAKMLLVSLTTPLEYVFDPRQGIGLLVVRSEADFFGAFGPPASESVDFESLDRPPRFQTKIWNYRCSDGQVSLRVQPRQDAGLLVTTKFFQAK